MRNPVKIRKRLGEKVRRLRKENGWSQARLSEEAGMDKAFAGLIERGAVNVSTLTLTRIAKALNTTLSDLVDGID